MVRTVPHINYARSADGVSLAFTIAGNGPALVFVPWVPFSNLRMEWQNPLLHRVFEQLSRRLTVIHYDGRGTGHSQRDVADLSTRAVIKAVTKDRTEVVVMPGPGRLMRAIMDYFPGLGPAMNRAAGANASMQKIIELREAKAGAASD
jgi:hypothetical protein